MSEVREEGPNLISFQGKLFEVPEKATVIKKDGSYAKEAWYSYDSTFARFDDQYQWEKIGPEDGLWGYCEHWEG